MLTGGVITGKARLDYICVRNNKGSAKLMEIVSDEQGIKELLEEEALILHVEDEDKTLIARFRNIKFNLKKKRFDKYHVVKVW